PYIISSISPLENAKLRFVPKSSAGGVLYLKFIFVFSAYSSSTSNSFQLGELPVPGAIIVIINSSSTIGKPSSFTYTSADRSSLLLLSFDEQAVITASIKASVKDVHIVLFIIRKYSFSNRFSMFFIV